VLEVGGGSGLLTLWAAVHGARVVCLEPESAGSTSGVGRLFAALRSCMGATVDARMLSQTLDDHLARSERRFDVVVMANTVNHLDEHHCSRLHSDASARATYLALLGRLYDRINAGGYLLLTDCSRSNLFNDVGLRSPFMPTIEWDKHQSPYLWDSLLQEVGFQRARIQ
jgi:hypothetical protein